MKLKNKKTGKTGYPYFQNWKEITCVIVDENATRIAEYTSLAELNAEWEDYEEPKEYWFLSTGGEPHRFEGEDKIYTPNRKSIGNYFETKEEAEKVVEKLKAWKRLEDNGFKFDEWERDKEFSGDYIIKASDYHTCDDKDLDLLFGGEE